MATYAVSNGKHATLTAATVDTVTLTSTLCQVIEIWNRGTTDPIYFTKDGTTPTVGGDNTYVVTAGQRDTVMARATTDTIKLIAATAVAYSVTGDENLDS